MAHAAEICWLAYAGISQGWKVAGGYEFRPNNNVARADMAAFMHRLYDLDWGHMGGWDPAS